LTFLTEVDITWAGGAAGIAEKTDRTIVSKPGIDKCFRNDKMVIFLLKAG